MSAEWDVVVAGAGHNSLVAAAYLAKAGFRCMVLEARDRVGGESSSEALTLPGFVHDTCSTANPFWAHLQGTDASGSNVANHQVELTSGTELMLGLYEPQHDFVVDPKKRYDCFLGRPAVHAPGGVRRHAPHHRGEHQQLRPGHAGLRADRPLAPPVTCRLRGTRRSLRSDGNATTHGAAGTVEPTARTSPWNARTPGPMTGGPGCSGGRCRARDIVPGPSPSTRKPGRRTRTT